MKTIDNEYQAEYIINKSKFISFAYPISSVDQSKALLDNLRQKFSDATHICFAYILSSPKQERCSDDGEPTGTAGKPILELIKKKKLENVVIFVVRYFGGKKLGAGGLIRAYTTSAKLCLEQAQVIDKIECKKYSAIVDILTGDKAKRLIESVGGKILHIEYGEKVAIEFEIDDINKLGIVSIENLREVW